MLPKGAFHVLAKAILPVLVCVYLEAYKSDWRIAAFVLTAGRETETRRYSVSVQKDVSYTLAEFSTLVLTFRWIISARWDCQSGWKDSQVSVTVGVTDSGIKPLRLMNLIRVSSSLCVENLSKDWTASVAKRKIGLTKRRWLANSLWLWDGSLWLTSKATKYGVFCTVGRAVWDHLWLFYEPVDDHHTYHCPAVKAWQNIRPATSSKLVWTEAMS